MAYVAVIMIVSLLVAPIKEAGCLSADDVNRTVNAYTSMDPLRYMKIRPDDYNVASCIDFLRATGFRLDKAFSTLARHP